MDNEKKILFFCGSGHFYVHFYMVMFPSLALWIRSDLHMSLPDTLNLGFWMYLLFGVVGLPMGALADRWSGRNLMVIMLTGSGLSALACAMSSSPTGLMLGLAAVGLFASMYHPVGLGMISKCCKNRGRALGLNGVFGNLGMALAPFLAGAVAYLSSWRASYALSGLIALLIGAAMLRVRIDERPLSRDEPEGKRASAAANGLYFALIMCCVLISGFYYRGTIVSLPAYFEENVRVLEGLFRFGSDIRLSGSQSLGAVLLVSGVYLVGVFGQLAGGYAADRIDLRAAYLLFHAMSLPFMAFMAMSAEWPLLGVSVVYLFFSLGMQPIENSLVARLTPNRLRSFAYGFKFILVFGVGSFSVKLVKWIMTHHPTAAVYWAQSGMVALLVALIVLVYALSRGHSFRNT